MTKEDKIRKIKEQSEIFGSELNVVFTLKVIKTFGCYQIKNNELGNAWHLFENLGYDLNADNELVLEIDEYIEYVVDDINALAKEAIGKDLIKNYYII